VAARKRIGAISLLTGALAVGAAASGHWTTALLLGSIALAASGRVASQRSAPRARAGPRSRSCAVVRRRSAARSGSQRSRLAGSRPRSSCSTAARSRQPGRSRDSSRRSTRSRSRSAPPERAGADRGPVGEHHARPARRQGCAAAGRRDRGGAPNSNAPAGLDQARVWRRLAAEGARQLSEATRKLRVAEDALDASQREQAAIERARPALIAKQTKAVRSQIDGFRQAAAVEQLQAVGAPLGADRGRRSLRSAADQRGSSQAPPSRRCRLARAESAAIRKPAATRGRGDPQPGKERQRRAAGARAAAEGSDRPARPAADAQGDAIAIKLVAEGGDVEEIFQALGIRPPKATAATGSGNARAISRSRRSPPPTRGCAASASS
jgi:hypothetical protein